MSADQDGYDTRPLSERVAEATFEVLSQVWDNASSLAEAAENAQRLVQDRVDEVRNLIEGMDVFDTVENMRLAATPLNPEEYRESEHEGLLATAELAALLFLEHGTGQFEPISFNESAERLAEVHRILPELLRLQAVAGALTLEAEEKSDQQDAEAASGTVVENSASRPRIAARLRHSLVLRELTLRNPTYVHLEGELIERLFADPLVDAALLEKIGFSAEDLLAIFRALATRATHRLAHELRAAREELDDRYEQDDEFKALIDEQTVGINEAIDHIGRAMVFTNLRNIASFDDEQLATESGVPAERIRAALAALSWQVDKPTPGLVKRFLSGDNPLRLRPFLECNDSDGNSRWLLIHPGLLIFAVRPFLETHLSNGAGANTYLKHRAHVLEQDGLSTLQKILRPELTLQNVEYLTESGEPAETDGLIFVDRVALVVEAKSRPLSSKARTGHGARIRRDLSDVITDATIQADRVSTVLSSGKIVIRSAQKIDHEGKVAGTIRNQQLTIQNMALTLPIVLTLEDLNAVALTTGDLIESEILPVNSWPWIVNLNDLLVISEVVSLPAEMIHYLLRRRTASKLAAYAAHEELDLFMRYLDSGLFVDQEEPHVLNILLSHTDELDAWYAYNLGWRQTPAPKPSQPMSVDLKRLLDYMDEKRPPSWLPASIDLLELAEDSRDEIAGLLPKLAILSRQDGKGHSAAIPIRPSNEDWFGFVVASGPAGTSRPELADRLRRYVPLRKYASKLKRVTAFGVVADSPELFDVYMQIEGDWTEDEQLDVLVEEAGILRD